MNFCEKLLYQNCLDLWGVNSQVLICIEELNELAVILAHTQRKLKTVSREDIKTEIADVMITVEQMQILFKISEKEILERKADRLDRLLNIYKRDLARGTTK